MIQLVLKGLTKEHSIPLHFTLWEPVQAKDLACLEAMQIWLVDALQCFSASGCGPSSALCFDISKALDQLRVLLEYEADRLQIAANMSALGVTGRCGYWDEILRRHGVHSHKNCISGYSSLRQGLVELLAVEEELGVE
jgi:hypothetical protein